MEKRVTTLSPLDAARHDAAGTDASTDGCVERLQNALRVFEDALRSEERELRDELAMGGNDLTALRLILDGPDVGIRPSDIARALGISSAATTALIDRLERDGLVERAETPTDRRSVMVRSIIDHSSPARRAIDDARDRRRAVVSELSPTERAHLSALLETLAPAVAAHGR